MLTIRRIGGLVLAVAALVVFFTMAPEVPNQGVDADVSQALATDDLNQARTEGAPQQAVVNGWTARDLLVIQTRAIADANVPDQRPAALLLIAVIGLALGLVTSGATDLRRTGGTLAAGPGQSSVHTDVTGAGTFSAGPAQVPAHTGLTTPGTGTHQAGVPETYQP